MQQLHSNKRITHLHKFIKLNTCPRINMLISNKTLVHFHKIALGETGNEIWISSLQSNVSANGLQTH